MKSLEKVSLFLREVISHHQIDKDTTSDIHLAVEEIFTNMVKYNALATEHISISVETQPNQLSIQLTDPNSTPFDLFQASKEQMIATQKDRKSGGLGIHLVKRLMDSVDYRLEDGKSFVTVTKRLA